MVLIRTVKRITDRLFSNSRSKPLTFPDLFQHFHQILQENNRVMEVIADMEDKLGGEFVFDKKYLADNLAQIEDLARRSAYNLNLLTDNKYLEINAVIEELVKDLQTEFSGRILVPRGRSVLFFEEIDETMEEAVGRKAYNLSRVLSFPKTDTPRGFTATIAGFRKYLAYNNLFDKIEDLLQAGFSGEKSLASVAQSIRLLILGGDIPPDLRREILTAGEQLCDKKPDGCFFSVRSSAVGEDGEVSFAGLHDSFLNVPFRELLSNYKKVLASLYNHASLEYRAARKAPPTDMAMAVLYQRMASGRSAGVAYSLDPNNPQAEVAVVGCTLGLGKAVVEGREGVDTYRISRRPPHEVLDRRTGRQDEAEVPVLTDSEAALIVETALTLERYFKHPIDLEWLLDENGKLWVLQARPLGLPELNRARGPELKELLEEKTVVFKDQGIIAYRGVGAGPVWAAEETGDLSEFPSGAVLVSRFALPLFAKVIPRAGAVITEVGSPTGHMATVAREFRVPTIVDAGDAIRLLTPGAEVTVDAERNVVYEGRIEELLHHNLLGRVSFETTYEFQLLRRLLRRMAPLNLIDPDDPKFAPGNCRTIHDVIRFIHEKAVQTLIQIGQDPQSILKKGGKRLKTKLPLNLVVIDIGGGLGEEVGRLGGVLPEHIQSQPMKSLWRGMNSPGVWSTDPISADFKGLMSSLTRTRSAEVAGRVPTGLNVAVLGANYVNLSLRIGYHFSVVEAGTDEQHEKNIIFFRFFGGAASLERRSRRATLLRSILEKLGFKVEGKGDLAAARATGLTVDQMDRNLYLIGRLLGFARQLDVLMTDEAAVDLYFEKFLESIRAAKNGHLLKQEEQE